MLMNEGYEIEEGVTDEGIQFKRIGNKAKQTHFQSNSINTQLNSTKNQQFFDQ